MNTLTAAQTGNQAGNSGDKLALGKEIRAKWDKFSEIEVGALKGEGDLVGQLVAKYGLEKAQAQSDVTAFLNGRRL